MVYISLTKIALFITALNGLSNAQTYIGKRELDRDYYTINTENGKDSAEFIANKLGARFEGNVGELDHWYMLSKPKHIENLVSDFEYHKSRSIYKRDEDHWHQVKAFDKQVLKKRTKRAPLFITNGTQILQDAQKEFKIKDPLFPKQWHLVKALKNK